MKRCILAISLSLISSAALGGAAVGSDVKLDGAAKILPIELKWMNAPEGETTYKSEDHPGAVFVLEVYGLNCRYCNENVPNVKSLVEKYKNNAMVQILDVGTDKFDSYYQRWINQYQPTHPVLKDDTLRIYKELQTTGIPSTAVVDCQGNLQHVSMGVWDSGTVKAINNAIAKSLALEGCGAN